MNNNDPNNNTANNTKMTPRMKAIYENASRTADRTLAKMRNNVSIGQMNSEQLKSYSSLVEKELYARLDTNEQESFKNSYAKMHELDDVERVTALESILKKRLEAEKTWYYKRSDPKSMSNEELQVYVRWRLKNEKRNKLIKTILTNTLVAILAFIWIIPIIWLVCCSLSAYSGIKVTQFFPSEWTFMNYVNAFKSDSVNQFGKWFMNTLIVAVCTCLISTTFTLFVAYATSIMRFKMRKPLMNIGVVLSLFPGMLSMIAVYFILKTFDLTNSHIGLILVYSASSGLGYLIAKGFFDTIPRALCEAARIDGCSNAGIFTKLIVPLSKPIIVYTVIASFLGPWMDFVFAKILLNSGVSANYTVAVGLYRMLDKSLINSYFSIFCACGIIISVPISILYVIMQRFYVEGVTGGAVKG